jgi:2-polyprenyl-6-hydroxyphenyl methylase/3-demethylubiquinone-9 3-methyltransferase
MKRFEFGKNWVAFSAGALSRERVGLARKEFGELFEGIELKGKKFLDIGFGQGLSLLLASEAGAEVTGCDIDPRCGEALARTTEFFDPRPAFRLVIGSILAAGTARELRSAGGGAFDIVHAWGVLHHTGDMSGALDAACGLTAEGGHLVVAVYNKHWSSPLWKAVKRLYCLSPSPARLLLVAAFCPIVFIAKFLATGKSPLRQQRGMAFYRNLVDWVGGYPYEYASVAEVRSAVERKGFTCVRVVPAQVPTGCNQFVFRKLSGEKG